MQNLGGKRSVLWGIGKKTWSKNRKNSFLKIERVAKSRKAGRRRFRIKFPNHCLASTVQYAIYKMSTL